MRCPLCGKPARTDAGLRKHLTGAIPYGGHALTPERASEVVLTARTTDEGAAQWLTGSKAEVRPIAAVPPDEETSFLEYLFGVRLVI